MPAHSATGRRRPILFTRDTPKRVSSLSDEGLTGVYRSARQSSGMPTRYTVVCEHDRAREIQRLAREYDLTEEEVLRQLLDIGLEQID